MFRWFRRDAVKPEDPIMKRFIAALPLLALAACSGNYPHTALPSFWPGEHLAAGQYVNQDCVVGGKLTYGWEPTKAEVRCTALAVREWFK